MSEDSDLETRAKLAYDEALRVVVEQDGARDALRARAIGVLTVATIAASLFGFGELEANALFWIGLAGLSTMAVCVIFLYWPRDWMLNPARCAVVDYIEDDEGMTAAFMYANLARFHQRNYRKNGTALNQMSTAYIVLLVGLLTMVAAWAANAVTADSPPAEIQEIRIVETEEE